MKAIFPSNSKLILPPTARITIRFMQASLQKGILSPRQERRHDEKVMNKYGRRQEMQERNTEGMKMENPETERETQGKTTNSTVNQQQNTINLLSTKTGYDRHTSLNFLNNTRRQS